MSSLAAAYGMKKAKKHGGAACGPCGGGECMLAEGGRVGSGKQRHDFEKGVNKPVEETDDPKYGSWQRRSEAGASINEMDRTGTRSNAWMTNGSLSKDKRHNAEYLQKAKDIHHKTLGQSVSMKKPNLYAKGGKVDLKRQLAGNDPNTDDTTIYTAYPGQQSMGPTSWKPADGYGHEWKRNQNGSYSMDDYSEPPKKSASNYGYSYADGGMIDDDVVDNIMRERMSEGGQVANATPPEADEMPAEFDDLVLDDDLEGTNSGAADGDSIGDEQEDEDRLDVVKQVMRSRAKKDRNPRQA